jgi:Putative lumazine-binding
MFSIRSIQSFATSTLPRLAMAIAVGMLAPGLGAAQSAIGAPQARQAAATQVIEAFARAADRRDVAALEQVLHPAFRVMFTLDPGKAPTQLDRAQFLGMVREGKIGGADRQVVVSGVATADRFASASARMEHKDASFEGVYALVEQDGRWWLLQEAVTMKTGAAR